MPFNEVTVTSKLRYLFIVVVAAVTVGRESRISICMLPLVYLSLDTRGGKQYDSYYIPQVYGFVVLWGVLTVVWELRSRNPKRSKFVDLYLGLWSDFVGV